MTRRIRFWLFFTAMAIFCLGANFAHPVTPALIKNLGLHDYMFGAAFAAMMATNFLFSPFWGKLNDTVEARYIMFICCIGYGISQLGFAVAVTETAILAARLCAGVFTGGIFVSFLTYIVGESDESVRSQYLMINATIQSVFGAFGYLIGGVLGEVSIFLVFMLQAVVLIASGFLFLLVCKEEHQRQHNQVTLKQLVIQSNPFRAFLASRSFMTVSFAGFFGICIFMFIGQTGFDQSFNYFLKAELQLGSSYNGLVKAVVGLIAFFSNVTLCLAIIRRKQSQKATIVLNGICGLLCGTLVFLNHTAGFLIGGVLLYSANSVSIPLIQDSIAQKAEKEKQNLIMGFYNGSKSLGSIAGAMIAGIAFEWNARAPFVFAAGFFGLAFLLALKFMSGKKQ